LADLKTQKAMETIYGERFSPDALREFRERSRESEAEKKPQPPAKEADTDLELYQKIYDKLFETEPLEEGKVAEAARQRAEAIQQELTGPGGLESSRISAMKPAAAPDLTDGMVLSKLTLGAAK
ncbi:MAG: hypothetical protein ACM34H_08135, partial [Deltaproteobacteria bacterium]